MGRWHYLASAFFVLQGVQAFSIVDRLLYGEWQGKPGDKFTQAVAVLMMVTSLALFGRGFRRIKSVRTGVFLAIGLAGFLLCSAVWSIDPQTTARGAMLYLFSVAGMIGIATNLKSDEYMDLLALICFLAGVSSLVLYAVSPANAFGESGDFRGIFSQKNVLGEAMAMGALASLHGIRTGKRLRGAIFLGLNTIVALRSESATSCMTIFVFCGTDRIIALIQKGGAARIIAVGMIILTLPFLIFVAISPESMLEMLGKDPTLTGRTDIWGYVIPYFYQSPWLGWGYVAFWTQNNPAAVEIADSLHWFTPQAHNGLLEMLLHVGIAGTAFFILLWMRTVWLSLRCMRTSERTLGISSLLSCVGILLVGVSETVLLVPSEASTGVFFITGLMCERALRSAQRPRYSAMRWDVSHGIPVRP
jgi:O-antigen ligase